MIITKRNDGTFLVNTEQHTADNRVIEDICELQGRTLRTQYTPGFIHVVPPIVVNLGPESFARVTALAVNESAKFEVK